MTARAALISLLFLLSLANYLRAEDDERVRDEQTLREANLAWDDASLLDYFRCRTPTAAQRQRIDSLIEQLGHPSFRVREMASKELVALGLTAVAQLRQGRRSDNPEIANRCGKCLDAIEIVPSGVLTAAVARMTGRIKPLGGLEAILAYLPLADDDTASDGLRWALARLAARGGKAEPPLLKALNDEVAVKRGAAAEAIVRAGLKEHFAEVAKLRRDSDADVQLRTALILVTVARDKNAVQDLIAMLDTLPIHKGRQAEEVLHRIATESAPKETLADPESARAKCRSAWEDWWAVNAGSADLRGLDDSHRILGTTLMVLTELDGATGQVMELAPDGKTVVWKITGIQLPLDAQFLPGYERVLLAEHNSNVVTERDLQGIVRWSFMIPQPVSCQRLPDGNTVIAARDQIVEVSRNGRVTFRLSRNDDSYFVAARKSGNNQYVFVTDRGQVTRVDAHKNEIRSFVAPRGFLTYSTLQLLPNNRVLVPTQKGAVVIDELTGKTVWEAKVGASASSAQRLSNGNTVLCGFQSRAIWELDREGKILDVRNFDLTMPVRFLRR